MRHTLRLETCDAEEITAETLKASKDMDPSADVGDFIVRRHGNGSEEDLRRPPLLVRRTEFLRTWTPAAGDSTSIELAFASINERLAGLDQGVSSIESRVAELEQK